MTANTTVIVVKLDLFYRYFRRAVPINYLQSKADFLSNLPIFTGVDVERIFKIGCVSQKFRLIKEKILVKEGEKIPGLVIVCTGQLELTDSKNNGEKITI